MLKKFLNEYPKGAGMPAPFNTLKDAYAAIKKTAFLRLQVKRKRRAYWKLAKQ
jgi:hypothetical protein